MSTHNLCFEQKYEKYQNFPVGNFQILQLNKISIHCITRACFYNGIGVLD